MILTITLIGAIIGIPLVISGLIGVFLAARKGKLAQNIVITVEDGSEKGKILVRIDHPTAEKTKTLVEELRALLAG